MLRDAITLSTQRDTPEGYRETQATIATVGVLHYFGHEIAGAITQIPDNFDPNKRYGVFRGQDTVFHPQTLASVRLKPLTISHPPDPVDVGSFRKDSVGTSGENEFVDSGNTALGINLLWTDPRAIMLLKSGVKGLSAGYTLQLESEKGSFQGCDYDFAARGPMLLNHIALTSVPRNAEGTHVLDEQGGPMPANATKKDEPKKTSGAITDIDMTALISSISEKIMPKIEEMLGSEDFQNKLAERFAGMLAGSMDSDNGNGEDAGVVLEDAPVNVTPVDNSDAAMIDSKRKAMDKLQPIVDARVAKRVHVEKLAAVLSPKLETAGKKDKEILQAILKDSLDEDAEKVSVDYMLGAADRLAKSRQTNTDRLANLTDVNSDELGAPTPGNIVSLIKTLRKGVK